MTGTVATDGAARAPQEKRTWMVRAGERTSAAAVFEAKSVVALWRFGICWTDCRDAQAIERKLLEYLPERSRRQRKAIAAQIERFLRGIRVGDRVTTYDSARRVFLLGRIVGGPKYEAATIAGFPTLRAVAWDARVAHGALSSKSLRALRAMPALFLVGAYAAAELEANREPL